MGLLRMFFEVLNYINEQMVTSLFNIELQGRGHFCAWFWHDCFPLPLYTGGWECLMDKGKNISEISGSYKKYRCHLMRGSRLVHCSRICSVQSDVTSRHNFGKNVSSALLQPGSTSLYTLEIKSVHQLSIYLPLFCLHIFKMLEEVWFSRLIKTVFGYNITSLWKCQTYIFP